MSEPLWKIRQRKGMSINQLAAKSGVPAISIMEYESGQAIRSADLPKLARALYVEEWDIDIKGKPRPKPAPAEPRPSASTAPPRAREKKPPPAKARRPAAIARSSQIEHLLRLTADHFGKDRAALEKELGKVLEEMTRLEASTLLNHYQTLLAESRSAESESEAGTKRKRAYLPEGVDEFELKYLASHQESGSRLQFTLFDGQETSGHIIGFSPYSITIQEEETGEEVTLQKLAIAYYRVIDSPSEASE
jgi:transcriptional regulator with XRE-family HTH domain